MKKLLNKARPDFLGHPVLFFAYYKQRTREKLGLQCCNFLTNKEEKTFKNCNCTQHWQRGQNKIFK